MTGRTLFSERFGMLMASASPGSALAYELGTAVSKTDLVRRGTNLSRPSDAPSQQSETGWLGRIFERLEQWSWECQMRAYEAYLSEATDLADLEARMRRLDNPDEFSRARVLR